MMMESRDSTSKRYGSGPSGSKFLSTSSGVKGPDLEPQVLVLPARIGSKAVCPVSEVGRIVLFSPPRHVSWPSSHINLNGEAKLIDFAKAALRGLMDSSEDKLSVRRYVEMVERCMVEARRICLREGMRARAAATLAFDRKAAAEGFFERPETDEQLHSSRCAHPLVQDLPGNRNIALMAIDALGAIPENEWCACQDRLGLARQVFPQLFEVRENEGKIAIVATRSLAHWSVHFFGMHRLAAMVLPTEDHLNRGHLGDLLAALEAPVAVQCAGLDDPNEAAKIAAGRYLLLKSRVGKDAGKVCEVMIGPPAVLEAERQKVVSEAKAPLILCSGEVQTKDGAEYHISFEVDSLEVLRRLHGSPAIPIGIVKTEFLLLTEKEPREEIWELSVDRLEVIYTNFLREAGSRLVTFRLVDEVGEEALDKPVVPKDLRAGFREAQIRAMIRAALKMGRQLNIMIPNFSAASEYFSVLELIRSESGGGDKQELFRVIPLVEGPAGRRALRELQRRVKLDEVGIGFGDLCCRETRIATRNDPELEYPPYEVLHAMRDINEIAKMSNAKVTLFGRRAGEEKVLLLCEAAEIRSIGVHPSNFQEAVSTIQLLQQRVARWLPEKLPRLSLRHQREELYNRALRALKK